MLIIVLMIDSILLRESGQPRNQEKAETWEVSNKGIRDDLHEQRCVTGDQGQDHPRPRIPNYYAWMQKLDGEESG